MPGPPPSPNARRRNHRPALRVLPSAGRSGAPPPWPISDRWDDDVATVWSELWGTPQAVAWVEFGWSRVVARYALVLVASERAGVPISLHGELRLLEDRLGLTPLAMRRLMWVVDDQRSRSECQMASVSLVDLYQPKEPGS